MPSDTDINKLMEIVERTWPFDEKAYPSLKGASPEQVRLFAIRHIVHHMSKSTGRGSGECETAEHGGEMDLNVLAEIANKQIVNGMRLLVLAGKSSEDVVNHIWARENS